MKVFYVDDQQQDLPIVAGALADIERLVGTGLTCEFIGPARPGELQLHFDDEAQPNETISQDGGVSAASIAAAASTKDSMFLVDVRFPNDDDYGLQLARYLVDRHGIAAERIVLFTMFPEEVQRAEAVAGADAAWFTYFHKAKFRLPASRERLAFELIGAVWRAASPLKIRAVAPMGLIGQSQSWRECLDLVRRAAQTESTVLFSGETGTGKGLLAKFIYENGPRSHGPWVPVNCGAISANMFESEMFGHVRGAFTGAVRNKIGLFKKANGGTIFLDEISEIPMDMQVKFLRVLEEREIRPVGSEDTLQVNCRTIAATNCSLEEKVENGQFRKDLYYRLNVIAINVPPLRERKEDIPALVDHFLGVLRADYKRVLGVSSEALDAMTAYDWPGNVRELAKAIERGYGLAQGGLIGAKDLGLGANTNAGRHGRPSGSVAEVSRSIENTLPRTADRTAIENTQGQGYRGAADQTRVTWGDLYEALPGLAKSKVGNYRADRVYFKKVLKTAAMGNPDCRSWTWSVLNVLATHGPVLVTNLNDAEGRFLGFLLGVIHRYVRGGDTFLRNTCRISEGDINVCIDRAEQGNSHGVENAWASLGAAKHECQKLLTHLITEVVSGGANDNAE